MTPPRILVVDDDQASCEFASDALSALGTATRWCLSGSAALELMATQAVDVVLVDLQMQGMDGLELLRRVRQTHPEIVVIVVTGHGTVEAAIEALRHGVDDFVMKPVDPTRLAHRVDRALRHRALEREVHRLRQQVTRSEQAGLIGESRALEKVRDLVERTATGDVNVLILGASGTGKELVARAIHRASARKDGPFVAVDCAAIPETMLESELFGHARGAFTDARRERKGLFLEADGGTLFLDEIGEMPMAMQPKLLRALQERHVRPVGIDQPVAFDARVIAATNRDLETEVAEKRFREDLFYRLNVVQIELPPLRSRDNDVLLIAQQFVQAAAKRNGKAVQGILPDAAERLLAYDWPGNVRELANCIERAVALTRHDQITVADLPEKVRDHRASHFVLADDDPSRLVSLAEIERRYVERVLHAVGGNKTRAARVLGIARRSLYRKLAPAPGARGAA